MLIPEDYHSSWSSFLTDEVRNHLNEIESKLGDDYNPKNINNILRFLTIDINSIKVVWLGQDVYPAKGVATGRSFEVGGLTSWNDRFRQVSLKNIIRLIHKNYFGIDNYNNIYSFNQIKSDITNGIFRIKPPHQWFESLEQQGVLFLNTSFTCEVGKANSHKKLWEPFSELVLTFISEKNPSITWFLWGNEARSNKKFIKQGTSMESRHPMMCSESYSEDFLKSNCFLNTWDKVNWLG